MNRGGPGTLVVLAVGLAASGGGLRAQSLSDYYEGLDLFRGLVLARGLAIDSSVHDWRSPERDPRESLVMILGDPGPLARTSVFDPGPDGIGALEDFVHRGGGLLFASDRGDPGGLLAGFGVRLSPGPVVPIDLADTFQRGEFPVIGARNVSSGHPLFANALPIVTYLPGFIDAGAPPPGASEKMELRVVARFPPSRGELDRTSRVFAAVGCPSIPGRDPGTGRAVVLSDYSPFVNLMIGNGGNQQFASNILDFLLDLGERRHVLLVYHGTLVTREAAAIPADPLKKWRPPGPDQTLAAINRFISWLEDERILQGLASSASEVEDESLARILSGLAVVVTPLGMALVVLGALHAGRAAVVGGGPSGEGSGASGAVDPDPGATSLLAARAAEAVKTGDFADPMTEAARAFLSRAGLSRRGPVASWPRPSRVPSGWSTRSVRRTLARFDRFAVGRGPRPLRFAAFEKALSALRELETAHKNGDLAFDDEP